MDEARRGEPGGITALLRLVEEHPDAAAYDWRHRFHMPLSEIGRGMAWGEACSLARQLLRDPTSHLFAAAAEWKHPWSHEARMIADLYDLTVGVNTKKGKKPKPYPRPWKDKPKGVTSAKPKATQAQIRAAIAARAPEGARIHGSGDRDRVREPGPVDGGSDRSTES